jgi:DNA-binding GntR family transcriptional regulator
VKIVVASHTKKPSGFDPRVRMRKSSLATDAAQSEEGGKAPSIVAQKIREAILGEVFLPGEHLRETDLAEKFEVSRSPVREALLALEKESTVIISPYKGAIVKPLSSEEVLDMAELRLALISLVLKPAYRHLSRADFDHAYDLAKRLTRVNEAKEHFKYNREFWDDIFSRARRPILREVFRQLEDRGTRYEPLLLKLFPPGKRPRPREVLIEIYRTGKIAEAFLAFRKIYLEIVDQLVDHLRRGENGDSAYLIPVPAFVQQRVFST